MDNQIWIVAKYTYLNRLKTKGFWALVLAPLIIPIIALVMGGIVSNSTTNSVKLAIVSQPSIASALKKTNINISVTEVSTEAEAKSKLYHKKVDGVLTYKEKQYILTTTQNQKSKFDIETLQKIITENNMSLRATNIGLTQEQLKKLTAKENLEISTIGEKDATVSKSGNSILSTVTAIVIFLLLSLYIGVISQEISNEKSNRIMEILLAATNARVQYYGKILGVMFLALTQILIYILGFTVSYIALRENNIIKWISGYLNEIDMLFLIYVIAMMIFAIVGYLFIASIIASLINDQSQVQQVTSPIMYTVLIGYLGAIISAQEPGNSILKILSFIPFISPTLMSSRYAAQMATTQDALTALALQILSVFIIAKLGEKIYARNVLSYSTDRILKQLYKNISSQNYKARKNKSVKGDANMKHKKRWFDYLIPFIVALVVYLLFKLLGK